MTRSAIVTGTSRGIGRAITEALLADGWEVLGISRTMPDEFDGDDQLSWFEWDLGQDPADCEQPEWLTGDGPYHPSHVLRDDQGTYDALIHCAGIRGPYGPFSENDPDEWAATIATNLIGTARIIRAALPLLRRSEDARILLFSGGGAFSPEPGYSAYAASKGGTIALMESLAVELADTTVTVNAVAPGFISTDIHKGTPHAQRQAPPDAMANAVACVRHLLSPAACGLTGRTVSAQWDDYLSIDQLTIDAVNSSDMGKRVRHKIEGLRAQMIRRNRAI